MYILRQKVEKWMKLFRSYAKLCVGWKKIKIYNYGCFKITLFLDMKFK